MAHNKNQHYVPQLLLRQFASDADKKRINILNIQKSKIIRDAPLKNQCSKDYFYGKDLLVEKGLCLAEGAMAEFIRSVSASRIMDGGVATLMDVVMLTQLQRARTARASAEIDQMVDAMAKLMLYGKVVRDELERFKITLTYSPSFSIQQMMPLSPLLFDLKHFLLVNRTKTPFVISDCPVVHTNWFMRTRMPDRSSAGIGRPGLQIYMPVSPNLGIFLHDRQVYKAKCSGHNIQLNSEDDIDRLNILQLEESFSNLYFNSQITDEKISEYRSVYANSSKNVRISRMNPLEGETGSYVETNKTVYDPPDEGVMSEIVHVQPPPSAMPPRLSFVKIRPKPKFFDDGSAASPSRDPAWMEICSTFSKTMSESKGKMGDFWGYARAHPRFPDVGFL